MSEFISAMTEWNKKKDRYVAEQLSTESNTLSPRKNILVTVPLLFEEEIKAFVKAKRKEADVLFVAELDTKKTELSIVFESVNPAPRRSDYE